MAASTYEPRLGRTGLNSPEGARLSDSSLAASPLTNVAYQLTLLFIVLLVGRVPEITAQFLGSSFYQILILNVVLAAFLVITGTLVKVGITRGGTILIAFHLWVLFTLPFSGYRRGSVDAWVGLLPIVPSLFYIGGFVSRSAQTLRRGLWAFAWAGIIGLAFIHKEGAQLIEDRLSAGEGTFGNSNLVAIYLLLVMPVWAYIAKNTSYQWVTRLFFMAVIADSLSLVLKTGSRSGFMTMCILAVITFTTATVANKAKLLVVGVIGVFLAFSLMSENVRSRIGTLFHSEAKDEVSAEAIDSSGARMALLLESIDVTIKHPLIGTGFGVYSATAASDKAKKGQRGLWQVTHNMYTQVSAELGVPGIFLYLAAVLWSIRTAWRVRRSASVNPRLAELAPMGSALICMWIVFCFNGFFTSMALDFMFYVLSGYSIAIALVFEDVLRRVQIQNSGNLLPPPRSSRFFPAAPNAVPAPAVVVAGGRQLAEAADDKNSGAPWKRNPRKYPPTPGAPSR